MIVQFTTFYLLEKHDTSVAIIFIAWECLIVTNMEKELKEHYLFPKTFSINEGTVSNIATNNTSNCYR